MCLRCLVELYTISGTGYAVVCVNSLHQLAVLMPASVVSYEVQEIEQVICPAYVIDAELYTELTKISSDVSPIG